MRGIVRRARRLVEQGDPRDDRGAIVPVVGLVMVALLISTAFVLDIGMQRVGRADMQALADVVALDLARELDGRSAATLAPVMEAEKNASVARNQDTVGELQTCPGGGGADLRVELGTVNATGDFTPVAGASVPTAVRVTACTAVAFALGELTKQTSGDAARVAVATAQQGACFRVGSFVASVDTTDSALLNPLLGGMLNSSLNLDVVSYQGLANANVSLAELVQVGGLGVGSVEELLALDNVSVGQLFIAAANALDAQGNALQANILRSITVGAGTPSISIGDLISAAPGDQTALTAELNVLDLVTGAAFVANGSNFVSIPNLGINLPGVASTTATLHVIQAPRQECGPVGTTATTAQVSLDLTAHFDARTVNVPALGTNVTIDPFDIRLTLDVGQAIAQLTKVNCSAGGADSIEVDLRSAVLGSLSLSASTGVHANFSVPLIGGPAGLLQTILDALGLGSLLQPPKITLDATLSAGASAGGTSGFDKHLVIPLPGGYTTPVGSGPGDLINGLNVQPNAGATLTLQIFKLIGGWQGQTINAGPIFNTVFGAVDGVVNNLLSPLLPVINDQVLKPLENILGLQLGGARVSAVPTPTCGIPRLIG